jgi:hypothetical protein
MNWLKTLWSKLVNKTSVCPTLVVVEEEKCGDILRHICISGGVKNKDLASGNIIESFEEWYDGPCNEESIRACLEEFKAAHPAVAAKLQGKL